MHQNWPNKTPPKKDTDIFKHSTVFSVNPFAWLTCLYKQSKTKSALSAEAVECTNCFFANKQMKESLLYIDPWQLVIIL